MSLEKNINLKVKVDISEVSANMKKAENSIISSMRNIAQKMVAPGGLEQLLSKKTVLPNRKLSDFFPTKPLINFETAMDKANLATREFSSTFASTLAKRGLIVENLDSGITYATSITDVLNKSLSERKGFMSPMEEFSRDIKKNTPKVVSATKVMTDATTKAIRKVKNEIADSRTPFAGWALSILFAGMALQRFSTQLIQFGTKAYNDIAHSVEGTTTANDRLTASMTMLGFSVGEALQPLVDSLVPVVDTITEWVNNNPKLVSSITELGLVLGTLMATGGGLVLAKNGFSGMIEVLKKVPTTADGVKNYDWKGFGETIRNGIGVISIVIGITTATDAIKEFSQGTGEGTIKGAILAMSSIFTIAGGLRLIQGKAGGVWMAVIGIALEEQAKGRLINDLVAVLAPFSALINTVIDMVIYNSKRMWESLLNGGKSKSPAFDFAKSYQYNLKGIMAMGNEWQKSTNEFMYGKAPEKNKYGDLVSPTQGTSAKPTIVINTVNNYGGNVDRMLLEIDRATAGR